MFRDDPRPEVLFADAHAADCGRLADPACRDRHGPKRKAKGRWGVRGTSPDTPFFPQEKKKSVFFFFFSDAAGDGRDV